MGTPHYVIIGNGMAGNQAAAVLRERDPDCRITVISAGSLLFYNRYDLPGIFKDCESWIDLLVHPPEYYEQRRIVLRRKTLVSDVDTNRHVIKLAHREEVSYDGLIVATGGFAFIPEHLQDTRHLMHFFSTFRAAMEVRDALPAGGKVIMLGGDMMGLDLARSLLDMGYHVAIVPEERTFWPHTVTTESRPRYFAALEKMGIEIAREDTVEHIEVGARGMPARRVILTDGSELYGDVVMPSYGLLPSIEFMSNSGVAMERGILVDAHLKASVDDVWAAGDVCQIWSPELNDYRFYYGYRNVRLMGDIAAHNMTGDTVEFSTDQEENLEIDEQGFIYSPFWERV
jgi:NAD(P)H-nitrite reductase large subunit